MDMWSVIIMLHLLFSVIMSKTLQMWGEKNTVAFKSLLIGTPRCRSGVTFLCEKKKCRNSAHGAMKGLFYPDYRDRYNFSKLTSTWRPTVCSKPHQSAPAGSVSNNTNFMKITPPPQISRERQSHMIGDPVYYWGISHYFSSSCVVLKSTALI